MSHGWDGGQNLAEIRHSLLQDQIEIRNKISFLVCLVAILTRIFWSQLQLENLFVVSKNLASNFLHKETLYTNVLIHIRDVILIISGRQILAFFSHNLITGLRSHLRLSQWLKTSFHMARISPKLIREECNSFLINLQISLKPTKWSQKIKSA